MNLASRFLCNPRSIIFRVDLDSEIQKNKALEGDVENFQRRQRFMDEIKVLEQKRPWLEYETKRIEWNQQKEKLKEKVRVNRGQGSLYKTATHINY